MKKLILVLSFIPLVMKAQTQLIAHRGYWKTTPETAQNSLESLKNAAKLPIYGSEFDVRMSKDEVLVVNHDEDFQKVVIADTNFNELKKLKLKNGEPIPTFKDYLKAGKKHKNTKLIIELKPAKTEALEDVIVKKSVEQVKRQNLEQQVEFISFSLNICKKLKTQFAEFKVHYLNGDLSPKELKELHLDGLDYHYSVLLEKHPSWITEAKALGLLTNSWTVDKEEVAVQLKNQGIDFITTNTPENLSK